MSRWIHVLLKVDNGGTASVFCQEIVPDPIFPPTATSPGKVILKNVQALSWPVSGKWMRVEQWSIDKDSVVNWMVGPVRDSFDISTSMLSGETQQVPWPPGSTPHMDLANHPEEVAKLVPQEPAPAEKPAPKDAPKPKSKRKALSSG